MPQGEEVEIVLPGDVIAETGPMDQDSMDNLPNSPLTS